MDQTPTTLLPGRRPVPPGPFTVDEYYRLAEDGVLHPDDRVELLEGELVWMNAVGVPHVSAVMKLTQCFAVACGERALLSVQNPVRLDRRSQPQPDLMLLVPRADYYSMAMAGPRDVLLLVEVSDSSLSIDRNRKRALYARHGIVEYWIINLDDRVVEVSRNPGPDGYAPAVSSGPGKTLTVQAVPGISLKVDDILP